nr:helix-turn-helix domain-containing protein [Mesorhizobium sp. B2-2-4]
MLQQDPERMSRDQLIARVDSLEAQLEAVREANSPADTLRVQRAFGLTMHECSLLLLLSDGRPRRKEQIHSGIYSDRIDDPPEIKIIDVFICKVRKKVEPFGVVIETIWGSGYSLSDPRGVIKAVMSGEEPQLSRRPGSRQEPPHLQKRKAGEDFTAVFADIVARSGGRAAPVRFTSREMAARTGVHRTISVLLRWLESHGKIKIIKSPPPGGRCERNWIVQIAQPSTRSADRSLAAASRAALAPLSAE